MSHPSSRAERRHHRDRVVARRRFVYEVVWRANVSRFVPAYTHPLDLKFTEWGRYAKFNLGCGCTQCHAAKYMSSKDKRRRALKGSWSRAEHRRRDKAAGS